MHKISIDGLAKKWRLLGLDIAGDNELHAPVVVLFSNLRTAAFSPPLVQSARLKIARSKSS